MRAARYRSLQWHKRHHDAARARVSPYIIRICEGDAEAGTALVEYLSNWLHEHTRLADMMLAAFLRNHQRGLYKLRMRAGTRPADSCEWFDLNGQRFDPSGDGEY
jgi:hemerythrin